MLAPVVVAETRKRQRDKQFDCVHSSPVSMPASGRAASLRMTLDEFLATAWAEHTEDERQDVLRWLLFDNHKFTSYFASYRFMKAFGPTAPDPAVMAWLKARTDSAFGIVEKHLAARAFMVGSAPTIADFSMCAYLF